jgi:membrane dipeptidase
MFMKNAAEQLPTSRANSLFRDALVWDNVWPVDLKYGPPFGNDWRMLERFVGAGVSVLGITLAGDNHNVSQAVELVGWARQYLLGHSDRYVLVETIDDALSAQTAGKLGVSLQFEGTRCFERNLDLVELYYKLGVRQTILAFNNGNSVGGGCAEEHDSGLTNLGRRFVKEFQTVGMLVDLSHVGHRTSLDALEISTKPMVFTHSNAYAVHPSFRNVRDDQIKACAAAGGLIGVSGSSEYLGDAACRTETVFRHVDYLVQLVGPDHVGIGFDVVFDSAALNKWVRSRPHEWPMTADSTWPGFNYVMPEQLEALSTIMVDHGYGEDTVLKILGKNYVRVCTAAWTQG